MFFQLQNSPTLALLHKRHAGVLLTFFQKVFREGNLLEIPEERLEGRWQTFIEEEVMLSDWEGETPTNTAKFYLEEWCKNRWLARTYDENESTYLYRLTAHTEQALLFVEQHLTANRRAFIGTESNFSKIWHSLSELAEKTQTDPRVREQQLMAERDRIDAEIMELRQTGKPRRLDDTAVKARLYDLVAMANRFLADFRSVEDSFRKQRDEIQNLYLEQEQSRGDILAGALDAVELLKDSDEGRSFFGFQRLLRSSDEVDNHDKLALVKGRQKELEKLGAQSTKDYNAAKAAQSAHLGRVKAAENLLQSAFTYEQISEVDIQTAIATKAAARDALAKDPALAKLSGEIAIAGKDLKEKNRTFEAAVSALAIAENDEEKNLTEIERLKAMTAVQAPELENLFILIARRAIDPITDLEGLDGRKASLHQTYSDEIAIQHSTAATSATAAVMKMGEIIMHPEWGHLHDELGSTPPTHLSDQAAERFRRVEDRIKKDDIPKNEDKFRRLLQENVISDFNTFRTSLSDMEQSIMDRIATINGHLAKVDFDRRPGLETYIRLIPEKTRDQIVRDFRVQLNGALKDILNIDEDLEARTDVFHQVNALIEDLDKDAKRRGHIIDVRNWFDFKAEERYRNPDKQKETYQGAIAKSGGEKSRLASTILATASIPSFWKITTPPSSACCLAFARECLTACMPTGRIGSACGPPRT